MRPMTVTMMMATLLALLPLGAPARAACVGDEAAVTAARQAIQSGKPEEAMTRARLESDLARPETACAIFALIAADESAPTTLRWQALVSEGVALRKMGSHAESVKAFQEAFTTHGQDREALAYLVHAVTGVKPDPRFWADAWQEARFEIDTRDPEKPASRVILPSIANSQPEPSEWTGQPISINLRDADLPDLLRLFGELSGLDVDIDPALTGRRITLVLDEVPWDQALALVARAQGLSYSVGEGRIRVFVPSGQSETLGMGMDDGWRQRKTLDDLRSVALCLVAHRSDNGRYPPVHGVVDVVSVASLLEPMYIATLPRHDAWGHPLRYRSDGETYVVASPGKDGAFDHADLTGYENGGTATSFDADLVHANGRPLTGP